MSRRLSAALPAALVLCLVSACGDDEGDEGDSASAEPARVSIEVTEQGKGSRVEVPASVEAGAVTFTLENTGKAPHDAQIIRVEGDQSVEQVQKVIAGAGDGKPIPDWFRAAGGVGTVAPGQSGTATDVLQRGTHYVLDTSPDRNGGTAKFEVTGEGGSELPAAEATVETVDYGFRTSGLSAGRSEITFDNAGNEPHHVIAAPIAKGATLAQVRKFFSEDDPSGPPPADFDKAVGTAVIDGGTSQVAELELQKGRYALVCFISDRAGGPPHVAKGMLDEVAVE